MKIESAPHTSTQECSDMAENFDTCIEDFKGSLYLLPQPRTQAYIQSGYEATSFHSLVPRPTYSLGMRLPPSTASYPGRHIVWERGQQDAASNQTLLDENWRVKGQAARIALLHPVYKLWLWCLQVETVMTELKSTRKIATATHNILAYR